MIIDRIPKSPPIIDKVEVGEYWPLWSIMIPTFNCAEFLVKTLQSVLIQDTGINNMQIEVIDDCSTDMDIEQLVRETGKGRINFFRQEQNVGSLRNFETCIKRSRGQWIHLLHGDDLVQQGFYREIEDLVNTYPAVGAAFTGFSVIDLKGEILFHNNTIQNASGIVEGWLLKIAEHQYLQTCAIVVKRSVYEALGGFFGVHYGEDWEMWVRIASRFPVAYSPRNLAQYRVHSNSITARYLHSGQNTRDIVRVIEIIQNYLPAVKRKELKKLALKNYSIYLTNSAQVAFKNYGTSRVALNQAKDALLLNFNQQTFISLLKLIIKVIINYRSGK